jgi:hypothetical protein
VKKGVAVLAFPSKLVWAEIESIYSLDINCYLHSRITASQEHLLELEKSINIHEKVVLF